MRCGRNISGLGRQIVMRAFERAGKAFSDEMLKKALPRLARGTIEDVLAAVGRGEMYSGDVVKAVHPEFKEGKSPRRCAPKEAGWFGMTKATSLVFKVPGPEGKAERNPFRSVACRAICRCASRPMVARCQATGSSAF